MKNDIRYTPSDSFDTYPFLHLGDLQLELIGEKYYNFRREIMISRNIGMTAVYNLFHNSFENAEDIEQLRQLHTELDTTVAKSYGWEDLKLCHGFYHTKHGIRYTIAENAAKEVLIRLIRLNQVIYQEEVKDDKNDNSKPSKPTGAKRLEPPDNQLFLFDLEN